MAADEKEGERERESERKVGWVGGPREKEAKQQRWGLKTEKRCQWRRRLGLLMEVQFKSDFSKAG